LPCAAIGIQRAIARALHKQKARLETGHEAGEIERHDYDEGELRRPQTPEAPVHLHCQSPQFAPDMTRSMPA
jgi:hypothetical protein